MLATDLCGEQYGRSRRGGIASPNQGNSLMGNFGVWPLAAAPAAEIRGSFLIADTKAVTDLHFEAWYPHLDYDDQRPCSGR